jgi:hypothetical protein
MEHLENKENKEVEPEPEQIEPVQIENQTTLKSNINQVRKPKEERLYVKSNKGTKIELKNLDQIKLTEESNILDEWTKKKLSEIKNITFKNNVFDIEKNMLVSSIRLVKTSKLGRKVTPMIWEYYKNRGNLDVNQVIKKYSRENLIINYSICPQQSKKIIVDVQHNDVQYNNVQTIESK